MTVAGMLTFTACGCGRRRWTWVSYERSRKPVAWDLGCMYGELDARELGWHTFRRLRTSPEKAALQCRETPSEKLMELSEVLGVGGRVVSSGEQMEFERR